MRGVEYTLMLNRVGCNAMHCPKLRGGGEFPEHLIKGIIRIWMSCMGVSAKKE